MSEELMRILLEEAAKHMKHARKFIDEGLLIAETKKGLVELTYNHITKIYRIVSQDGGRFNFRGNTEQTAAMLVKLYMVEVN